MYILLVLSLFVIVVKTSAQTESLLNISEHSGYFCFQQRYSTCRFDDYTWSSGYTFISCQQITHADKCTSGSCLSVGYSYTSCSNQDTCFYHFDNHPIELSNKVKVTITCKTPEEYIIITSLKYAFAKSRINFCSTPSCRNIEPTDCVQSSCECTRPNDNKICTENITAGLERICEDSPGGSCSFAISRRKPIFCVDEMEHECASNFGANYYKCYATGVLVTYKCIYKDTQHTTEAAEDTTMNINTESSTHMIIEKTKSPNENTVGTEGSRMNEMQSTINIGAVSGITASLIVIFVVVVLVVILVFRRKMKQKDSSSQLHVKSDANDYTNAVPMTMIAQQPSPEVISGPTYAQVDKTKNTDYQNANCNNQEQTSKDDLIDNSYYESIPAIMSSNNKIYSNEGDQYSVVNRSDNRQGNSGRENRNESDYDSTDNQPPQVSNKIKDKGVIYSNTMEVSDCKPLQTSDNIGYNGVTYSNIGEGGDTNNSADMMENSYYEPLQSATHNSKEILNYNAENCKLDPNFNQRLEATENNKKINDVNDYEPNQIYVTDDMTNSL